jgi:LmbE family N-acetylglucosaminyl deacetylase
MRDKVIVVSPHPDDETLGCGGALLKHKAQGDSVIWLNITGMSEEHGFSQQRIAERKEEMRKVAEMYAFDEVYDLALPTMQLDALPISHIVELIGKVIKSTQPNIIYIPYPGDVHTDHRIVFDATVSCTKWFRYPSIRRILAYETLSETDFGINPDHRGFRPNVFVDISEHFQHKIEIMKIYKSEFGEHPFPRSLSALEGLALYRGATAGCKYAEAFLLLKERI